jgi:hypothetical protein
MLIFIFKIGLPYYGGLEYGGRKLKIKREGQQAKLDEQQNVCRGSATGSMYRGNSQPKDI